MTHKKSLGDSNVRMPWGWFFLVVFAIVLIYLSKSLLAPFLIALLLAYAFDPVVDFLEEKACARSVAIAVIFSSIVLTLLLILFFVIPTIQDQLTRTFDRLPSYLDKLQKEVIPALETRFSIHFPKTFEETYETVLPRLKEKAPDLFKPVTAFVLSFFTNTLGMLTALANLVMIPFMFYYLLKDFDRLKENIASYIPIRYRAQASKRLREIDLSLSGFIRGQLLVILFLGIFYVAGLSWIGLDLSFALGLIAAAGEIVPYIGFTFGLALSLAIAFLQFQDFLHPLYVAFLFGGVQAIQGLAIAPLVMGKQVGLHPLVIVAAVYIGGDLFGFIGVLLAVPGAAILVVVLKALADYYRHSELFRGSSM